MRIAVLGMGQMGRALASRLLDTGHDVTVWNRSAGPATPLVSKGATEATSPAAAAALAEVIMTVLTDDDAVLSVLLPGGARLPVPTGALVVDCSTVDPGTTRALAAAYDGQFAAAPILGGPSALATGAATLVVGGPEHAVDRLMPLLGTISKGVRRCGDDPGSALVAKLVNNFLLMAGIGIVSEAVVAAQRAGLDDDVVADMLSSSAMVPVGLHNRIRDLVDGDHEGWFPTPMGAKDVGLFLGIGATPEHRLPIADLIESRYREAGERGMSDKDITAVIELLRH